MSQQTYNAPFDENAQLGSFIAQVSDSMESLRASFRGESPPADPAAGQFWFFQSAAETGQRTWTGSAWYRSAVARRTDSDPAGGDSSPGELIFRQDTNRWKGHANGSWTNLVTEADLGDLPLLPTASNEGAFLIWDNTNEVWVPNTGLLMGTTNATLARHLIPDGSRNLGASGSRWAGLFVNSATVYETLQVLAPLANPIWLGDDTEALTPRFQLYRLAESGAHDDPALVFRIDGTDRFLIRSGNGPTQIVPLLPVDFDIGTTADPIDLLVSNGARILENAHVAAGQEIGPGESTQQIMELGGGGTSDAFFLSWDATPGVFGIYTEGGTPAPWGASDLKATGETHLRRATGLTEALTEVFRYGSSSHRLMYDDEGGQNIIFFSTNGTAANIRFHAEELHAGGTVGVPNFRANSDGDVFARQGRHEWSVSAASDRLLFQAEITASDLSHEYTAIRGRSIGAFGVNHGAGTTVGVHGHASWDEVSGGMESIGILGEAGGGGVNWAGYFRGKVYAEDDVETEGALFVHDVPEGSGSDVQWNVTSKQFVITAQACPAVFLDGEPMGEILTAGSGGNLDYRQGFLPLGVVAAGGHTIEVWNLRDYRDWLDELAIYRERYDVEGVLRLERVMEPEEARIPEGLHTPNYRFRVLKRGQSVRIDVALRGPERLWLRATGFYERTAGETPEALAHLKQLRKEYRNAD